MNEPGWWRRNLVAIYAIIALVVTGAAVAVILTIGHKNSAQVVETSSPQHPDLSRLVLNDQALGEIMGNIQLQSSDQRTLYTLPSDSTTVAECMSVDMSGQAETYANIDWSAAFQRFSKQTGGQDTQAVNQVVVLVPSPDSARKLLDSVRASWRGCEGKEYKSTKAMTATWVMHFSERGDIIVAVVTPSNSTGWSCEHAYGIKSVYIAEASVCGTGKDQAEAIVKRILANSAT